MKGKLCLALMTKLLHAETMPKAKDGDVYMMRLILHDWDDKDSIAILSSIRQAMGSAKARLLIVEVGPPLQQQFSAKGSGR